MVIPSLLNPHLVETGRRLQELGTTLPAQADQAVVEFYIEAADIEGNVRVFPNSETQGANLLYQVDDGFDPEVAGVPGSQPVYRIIMTETERGGTGPHRLDFRRVRKQRPNECDLHQFGWHGALGCDTTLAFAIAEPAAGQPRSTIISSYFSTRILGSIADPFN